MSPLHHCDEFLLSYGSASNDFYFCKGSFSSGWTYYVALFCFMRAFLTSFPPAGYIKLFKLCLAPPKMPVKLPPLPPGVASYHQWYVIWHSKNNLKYIHVSHHSHTHTYTCTHAHAGRILHFNKNEHANSCQWRLRLLIVLNLGSISDYLRFMKDFALDALQLRAPDLDREQILKQVQWSLTVSCYDLSLLLCWNRATCNDLGASHLGGGGQTGDGECIGTSRHGCWTSEPSCLTAPHHYCAWTRGGIAVLIASGGIQGVSVCLTLRINVFILLGIMSSLENTAFKV